MVYIEFLSVLYKPLYLHTQANQAQCLVTPSVPGAVVEHHHCVTQMLYNAILLSRQNAMIQPN